MENKIKEFKEFVSKQLDDFDEFRESNPEDYTKDIVAKARELFVIPLSSLLLKEKEAMSFEVWRKKYFNERYDGKYVHKTIKEIVVTHNETVKIYQKYCLNL